MKYIVDTTELIINFRSKDKTKSSLNVLKKKGQQLAISTITVYEILYGCKTDEKRAFWREKLKEFRVLPFDENAAAWAAVLQQNLVKKGHSIEIRDLYIAAIAVANGLPLATHNWKHFEHIEELELRRF